MAYSTGSATDVIDLISKLSVFCDGNGWTIRSEGVYDGLNLDPIQPDDEYTDYLANGASGGSWAGGAGFVIQKGDIWIGVFADTRGSSYVGVSDLGNKTVYAPTRHPVNNTPYVNSEAIDRPIHWTSNMPGPYQAYHFFSGDDYVHVVVEVTPGSYRHFGFGVLEKAGEITNAVYAHGTRWNYTVNYIDNIINDEHNIPFDSFSGNAEHNSIHPAGTLVRADSDGVSPRWISMIDRSSDNSGYFDGWGGFRASGYYTQVPLYPLMRLPPSELTGRAVMFPCLMGVYRPGGFRSFVGSPRDVRWMRIDNLAPGDLFSIGPDQWRAFPIIRKNGPDGMEDSEGYGLAYRINS